MDRDVYAKLITKIKDISEKINAVNTDITEVEEEIGTLTDLTTTAKNNLVSAINELVANAGSLASLSTTAKTNLVSAINEIFSFVNPLATIKTKEISLPTIEAGGYGDVTGTLSTPADFGFVVGYIIQANTHAVPIQIRFSDKSTISCRFRNVNNVEISGGNILVYYV